MTASFRKINYSLRPAKYAERRMMRDIFRRTAPFGHIEDCQYVGFGSLWFTDFLLFHRSLGIKKMVSIESNKSAKKRVEANRPFEIDIIFEASSSALKKISWDKRQLVWLDFDAALEPFMLTDLATVGKNSGSGSVIAITINAQRAPEASSEDDQELSGPERFLDRFANHPLPGEIKETDLIGKGYEQLARHMLTETLRRSLNNRVDGNFNFQAICALRYADGARMITFVYLVFDEKDEDKVELCGFADLDFIDQLDDTVSVEIPILTPKECMRLESQLPLKSDNELDLHEVPQKDANLFKRFYRHLPNFVVLES